MQNNIPPTAQDSIFAFFQIDDCRKPTASNVTFTYRIMAKRKGYADERMRKTDAGKYDVNLYPERKAEIEAYWKYQGDQRKPPVNLND